MTKSIADIPGRTAAEALDAIAAGDVRPGHADYLTKARMAELAREAIETDIDAINALPAMIAVLQLFAPLACDDGDCPRDELCDWCRAREALTKAGQEVSA